MPQTVFVNPSKPRRRRRRKTTRRRRRNVQMKSNPRRKRRRRRNAGITPFVQPRNANPLILQNPRRRRKRRTNPKMNLNTIFNKILTYSGGSAIGAGANILAIRRIENDWLRNGTRVAAAVLGGMFLRGEMGAAMAGATLYPLFAEIALMTELVGGGGTEADLHELAADLEAALNEIDTEEYEADHPEYMFVP